MLHEKKRKEKEKKFCESKIKALKEAFYLKRDASKLFHSIRYESHLSLAAGIVVFIHCTHFLA